VSLTFLAFAAFGVVAYPIGLLADAIGERATLVLMGGVACLIVAAFALVGRGATPVEAGRRAVPLDAEPAEGR
jgi:hypothetical protein